MREMVLLFVLACIPVWLVGQTVELEEAFLNDAIKKGKWTAEAMQERGRMWRIVKKDYPVLPYDTVSKRLKFEYVIEFPGVTKAQAFKRAKEWGALNFGSLEAVTDYEDMESGKIIFEGWGRVWYSATIENMWGFSRSFPEERRVYFSMVLTIVDGKAKVNFENLEYLLSVPGYTSSGIYIPSQEFRYSIDSSFPLVNDMPDKWEGAVNLMRVTVKFLDGLAPSLREHVRSLSDDYRF